MFSRLLNRATPQARPALRIVTWNCCMALRKKWTQLASLAPDVAVIQECETPEHWPQGEYTAVAWHGKNKHKGLAVVTFGPWRLEPCEQLDPTIEYVLPVRITGPMMFNVLGVWTKGAAIKERSYIGQLHRAVQTYASWLTSGESAVIGDWNSNAQWDRERANNHTATVTQLAQYGLTSAYHYYHRLAHSGEPHHTWYLTKCADRGFHLDYCFIPMAWAAHLSTVAVGGFEQWRAYSDHCPIVVDLAA